jgi:hypothetical protein
VNAILDTVRGMYAHPWKRYGQDRLYVSLDDETQIGYWDRKTDQVHPIAPKYVESLKAFVADWKQEQSVGNTSQQSDPRPVALRSDATPPAKSVRVRRSKSRRVKAMPS